MTSIQLGNVRPSAYLIQLGYLEVAQRSRVDWVLHFDRELEERGMLNLEIVDPITHEEKQIEEEEEEGDSMMMMLLQIQSFLLVVLCQFN